MLIYKNIYCYNQHLRLYFYLNVLSYTKHTKINTTKEKIQMIIHICMQLNKQFSYSFKSLINVHLIGQIDIPDDPAALRIA